ncbi:hypothetical protein CQY20_27815 [Mycolicibacterium agri]|uniref:Uncharacterized protein n=1 Tax=Mycolicibacterium agri TaxID=36811 RepID=A0A2A7MQQ0_MYCAG|nr:IniB N-terminal domain-containing protein [Mycolicibacterium agri]PEG34004.1 hypothetical protein CQY20_27815 [Mycolicibacterium agri]GFG52917.1 hypothetical protein MAGR_43580 [Mycolicibacterium agri]
MANPLLDFVMSLVRDPDAAARYAADPSGAIQEANLGDVTSTDVNALIPVVSESLSMGTPTAGADALAGDPNVWTSGAATAAFDAFGEDLSVPTVDDGHTIASNVIDQPDESLHAGLDVLAEAGVPTVADFEDPSTQLASGIVDDAPLVGEAADTDWHDVVDDGPQPDAGDSGLDLFD